MKEKLLYLMLILFVSASVLRKPEVDRLPLQLRAK